MEQFLLRYLPTTPRFPVGARYLLSLIFVALTLAIQFVFDQQLQAEPLILYVPAIFLASLIFDRGSGFLATFASAAAVIATYVRPSGATIIPLLIFVLTGVTIAAVTETLRRTVERLTEAKAYADLLLKELAHRTKNDLATITSILRMQSRSEPDRAAQRALASAINRVEVVAKVHDRLQDVPSDHKIELAPYVEGLCQNLGDFYRDVRPVAIRVQCDDVALRSSQAAMVGLIVNELVTNAFKYAFPNERPNGVVEVRLQQRNQRLDVTVTDDGVGYPNEVKPGLGTRLINLLTKQMNGTMMRTELPQGSRVRVVVPLES